MIAYTNKAIVTFGEYGRFGPLRKVNVQHFHDGVCDTYIEHVYIQIKAKHLYTSSDLTTLIDPTGCLGFCETMYLRPQRQFQFGYGTFNRGWSGPCSKCARRFEFFNNLPLGTYLP